MFGVGHYLFLKIVALAFLSAYASLIPQVRGLWGVEGILPAEQFLNYIRRVNGKKAFWRVPTLFCWDCSERTMLGVAWVGVFLSFLLLLGAPPILILPLLWYGYFSFLCIGQDFLSFQWDILLLEVAIYAFLLSFAPTPPFVVLFACWFFTFRFLFSSGVVKLRSHCPSWRSLTAMAVHYETQPLPTRSAWYLHQLPLWFHKAETVGVLFVEIALPLLFFFPAPIREIGAAIQIALQLLIIMTGNYAFFNVLTIGLCCLLISDPYYPEFLHGAEAWAPFSEGIALSLVLAVPVFFLVLLNVGQLFQLFGYGLFRTLQARAREYHICNPYGLFSVMTTTRNEIIIEGSDDGEEWKPYRFYWKPQELKAPPIRVMPHQPRLDWQMWFAALSTYRRNQWYMALLGRLLQGSESVLSLFAENPFPDRPPRYIRSRFYRYHFSDWKTRKKTGQWWTREPLKDYTPVITREG